MGNNVKHILFDIGVVLLHLDYSRSLEAALARCDPARGLHGAAFFSLVSRDPMIAEFETGRITAVAFHEHFCRRTGFKGSFDEFVALWSDIFAENTSMLEFARDLARTYDIYFLTNASDIHVPSIYDRYPSLRFFKDDAVSCYMGVAKPDRAFYEGALAKFGIEPETCLFIDDRPENVEGARACAIRSVLYTTPEETIPAIRSALDR